MPVLASCCHPTHTHTCLLTVNKTSFACDGTLPCLRLQGQVVARPMMYLALTYDHRLIDGREAVTFLKSVALKVQDPTRLLLDL